MKAEESPEERPGRRDYFRVSLPYQKAVFDYQLGNVQTLAWKLRRLDKVPTVILIK